MSQPKMTVLVVDDEPIKRVTLQIELGEAGYEVVDAADAQIALRLMEGRTFDVVLTDLRMPGIDGIAFLDEIKRRSPGTYVILMTAYGTVDTAVEAIKRGAYDYVTKPFLTATLLEKLDRIASYRLSEQARDAAATRLKAAIGDARGLTDGRRRITWVRRTVARTDWARLLREHAEVQALVPAYTTTRTEDGGLRATDEGGDTP